MPELKNLRVREAGLRDEGLFRKLWAKYLKEQNEKGDLLLPSDKNLDAFTQLFRLYVSDEQKGTVLFVADQAVSMWGDPVSFFELSTGPVATCFGIYVEPEHRQRGISNLFHEKAAEILRKHGFEYCSTAHLEGDELAVKSTAGAGREVHALASNVYWKLKE